MDKITNNIVGLNQAARFEIMQSNNKVESPRHDRQFTEFRVLTETFGL